MNYLLAGVLLGILTIGFFVVTIIAATDRLGLGFVCMFVTFSFGLLTFFALRKGLGIVNSPEKEYQELLQNFNNAQGELNNFLEEHPEFKETE
jgi:hypothetical protein